MRYFLMSILFVSQFAFAEIGTSITSDKSFKRGDCTAGKVESYSFDTDRVAIKFSGLNVNGNKISIGLVFTDEDKALAATILSDKKQEVYICNHINTSRIEIQSLNP